MDKYQGVFELKVVDRTLFFNINGSLDEDLLKVIFLQVSHLIEHELPDTWASMVDLSQWGLHTPEVEENLIKFQFWAYKQGQRAEVCITSGSSMKERARKKMFEDLKLNVEHVFVKDEQQGKDWLAKNGYLNTSA